MQLFQLSQVLLRLPATEKPRAPAALVLLAQNERGYENLMALNSCLYLDSDGTLPQVQMAQLAAHAEGVICLTGGPNGPLGKLLQNGQTAKAQALLEGLAQHDRVRGAAAEGAKSMKWKNPEHIFWATAANPF